MILCHSDFAIVSTAAILFPHGEEGAGIGFGNQRYRSFSFGVVL